MLAVLVSCCLYAVEGQGIVFLCVFVQHEILLSTFDGFLVLGRVLSPGLECGCLCVFFFLFSKQYVSLVSMEE